MMSIGLVFWILMLIWLVFGCYSNRAAFGAWVGDGLVNWILLALLGWAVFGAAIHH